MKYIKDTLGVLNSLNNGILIGITTDRKSAGAAVRFEIIGSARRGWWLKKVIHPVKCFTFPT